MSTSSFEKITTFVVCALLDSEKIEPEIRPCRICIIYIPLGINVCCYSCT